MRKNVRTLGLLVLLVAVLTAAAPGVVRLRFGDTLSELAARHGVSVSALKHANHLKGDRVYAGQLLKIPGNRPAARTTSRTTTRTYVVRRGDNLTVLARRWGTTVSALKARNHLRSGTILVGQRLVHTVTVRRTTAVPAASGVRGSAARHRAQLAARSMPSKAAVRAMVRKSAKRHGVPASLALALAYQESGFQQRVVSPVDAIGVMQVLPSTARSLGRIHGRSYDLLKASDNVEAGVTLLADLLRATGSAPRALAGYYQGFGSIAAKGLLPQTHAYIRNVQLLQKRFR